MNKTLKTFLKISNFIAMGIIGFYMLMFTLGFFLVSDGEYAAFFGVQIFAGALLTLSIIANKKLNRLKTE